MAKEDIADAMRRRREALGLTQVAASQQTQISRTTWRELEAARREGIGMVTAAKLDEFLDWPMGTTARLFRDGLAPATLARIDELVVQQAGLTASALESTSARDYQAVALLQQLLVRLTPEGLSRVMAVAIEEHERACASAAG